MRHFKQLTLATLFSLSAIFLLAGCGPTDGEGPGGDDAKPSCLTDKDCKDGGHCVFPNAQNGNKGICKPACDNGKACPEPGKQICQTFTPQGGGTPIHACMQKCATSPECPKGQRCGAVSNTPGAPTMCVVIPCTDDAACGAGHQCNTTYKACEAKPSTGGPGGGPVSTGKKCTNATVGSTCGTGPIWNCNTGADTAADAQGTCEHRPLASVIIQDLSHVGDPACKDEDRGADILGVALVGTDGTIGAWGKNINPVQLAPSGGLAGGVYYSATEPSGPVSVTALDQCQRDGLSSGSRDFSATGCGGYMIFGFSGVDGNSYHTLAKGKVQVYEYDGNKCAAHKPSTAWPDDKYAVWGCIVETPEDFATLTFDKMATYVGKYCVKLSGTEELNGNASVNYPPAP